MKYLIFLLALILAACDEQLTDWQTTLAIDAGPRTSYRVVIIADVTADTPVVTIPDYATEVLIIREGDGYVRAHMTPENRDFVTVNRDTLRIRVR